MKTEFTIKYLYSRYIRRRVTSIWSYLSGFKSTYIRKTEEAIIDNLTEVVNQIINEEKQIRERLDKHNPRDTR